MYRGLLDIDFKIYYGYTKYTSSGKFRCISFMYVCERMRENEALNFLVHSYI